MTVLEHALAVARPELLVTTLLQHALGATRHALAGAYPEIGDDSLDLDDVDHACHVALFIVLNLTDLDELLERYRAVVEDEWRDYGSDDIPF
jgi:hypothetical protein